MSVRRRPEPLAVTAWALMANTVTTSALGVLFWAIASRRYSPQELGEDSALISAMILLSSVSQLNLSMGITRLLPQVQVRRWRPVIGAYALTAVVGAIVTGGFLLLAPRLSDGFAFIAEDSTLGLALLGAVVLWNIFGLQDAVLTSARWAAAIPVENGLFGLLKIAAVVWLAGGLIGHGVFFAWLLAMVLLLLPVNGLIFWRVLPSAAGRGAPASPTVVPLGERRLVTRYLATDYVAALLSQGSSALLPLLVLGVLGRADSAYFYVAFLIAGAIAALAQSLSISMVVEGAHDEATLVSLARRSAARYARFVAPAVACLILAAPLVLRPFGAAYVAHGSTLLRLLLAGTMAKAVVTLYLGIERVRGRVGRVLAVQAASFVLVSAGAILGMRWNGLTGLGLAWLLAQVIVAACVCPQLWRLIGTSAGGADWQLLEQRLGNGVALDEAATVARCSKAEIRRLTSPASGAWSDLLEEVNGARILVIDRSPGGAPRRLADRGATIGVADDDAGRLATRRRMLGREHDDLAGPTNRLLQERWDIICIDGVRVDRTLITAAAEALGSGGRLLVIADNRWSPMRVIDRAVGSSVGAPATRLGYVSGLLTAAGLAHHRVFGLLRSSTTPTSSFDVTSRAAAVEVLNAAGAQLGRFRLVLLAAMTHLARSGRSATVVPAWAVVASKNAFPTGLPAVGRIGYEWTTGARTIFGEPPQELEKRYATVAEADAEAMALTALSQAGLDVGPRLLSRPTPQTSRMTWCRGRSLSSSALSQRQRREWVSASASALRSFQDATRRPDGTVLVHGDYWLGNLLVEDGRILAIIDWGTARWGDPAIDQKFLVDNLGTYCHLRPAALDELEACRDLALFG